MLLWPQSLARLALTIGAPSASTRRPRCVVVDVCACSGQLRLDHSGGRMQPQSERIHVVCAALLVDM